MGCILGRTVKQCKGGVSKSQSFDSIESGGSVNQYQTLMTICQEGIYPIDEPSAPTRGQFDQAKFASSAVVYLYNTKQMSMVNVYYQAICETPGLYARYFPPSKPESRNEGLHHVLNAKTSKEETLKQAIDYIIRSDTFRKHLKVTNKLINNILHVAVKEDIQGIGDTLKRIGARHAELGIPARQVHAVRDSFMTNLESMIDTDRDVFKMWEAFIKYIINMMIKGMNDHYRKLMFVYWSVTPHKTCLCLPANTPRRPSGVDEAAILSMRNMAATIESVLD